MTDWFNLWNNNERFWNDRKKKTEIIINYFEQNQFKPKTILDIGCGLAVEVGILQNVFDTHLYLLDGIVKNSSYSNEERRIGFDTTDSMNFYLTEEELIKSWNERNLKYTFINAENFTPTDIGKVDFIYSGKSCGFHYPLNTYEKLINFCSTRKTKIIVDLRKGANQETKNFKIEKILLEEKKSVTAVIKFFY